MKKILLIRRIQTDQEWEKDCYLIGKEAAKELNYDFPYPEYFELLSEILGKYIADGELGAMGKLSLKDFYNEVFQQGFGYALKHEENPDYYEFTLSKGDIDNINFVIQKHIKTYYSTEKKALIQQLENLHKDTVIIYPCRFYHKILHDFYKHYYQTFNSAFNNDEQCIQEFLEGSNIHEYELIKLFF